MVFSSCRQDRIRSIAAKLINSAQFSHSFLVNACYPLIFSFANLSNSCFCPAR